MTNREFFNAIINGVASVKTGKTKDAEVNTFPVFTVNEDGTVTVADEIVEFAKAEIVKLDEKNLKKKGSLSDAQKENIRLADEIFDTLMDFAQKFVSEGNKLHYLGNHIINFFNLV